MTARPNTEVGQDLLGPLLFGRLAVVTGLGTRRRAGTASLQAGTCPPLWPTASSGAVGPGSALYVAC
jgi:hypothetical protein